MARTTMNQTFRKKKTRNLIRDSGFQKFRQSPRDGLAGGEKVKILEHLRNLLSQRDQKLKRKSDNDHWI
jgi:hypothetical protein